MEEKQVIRSTRCRKPPTIYTPSSTRTYTNTNMAYKLNAKKALHTKIEAADRQTPCSIEMKSSTLVITCTAGVYEILKKSIYEYYDQSPDKCYKRHTKTSKTKAQNIEQQHMIVEESLSVKNKSGNMLNRQLYRINMFNTTSRIDVNGYMLNAFITNDLKKICAPLTTDKSYVYLNDKIRSICRSTIGSIEITDNAGAKKICEEQIYKEDYKPEQISDILPKINESQTPANGIINKSIHRNAQMSIQHKVIHDHAARAIVNLSSTSLSPISNHLRYDRQLCDSNMQMEFMEIE